MTKKGPGVEKAPRKRAYGTWVEQAWTGSGMDHLNSMGHIYGCRILTKDDRGRDTNDRRKPGPGPTPTG